ncbi:monodehydroascorbate reductase [Aureococcus anophagefferens]|nr:monodehydroascorbate reductase [Aureococcus anophagefferens]
MAALTRLLAVLAAASALRINPLKAVTKLRGAKAGGAKRVVVVGNGMVGQRFVELAADKAAELGLEGDLEIVSFCEEPVAAYDRVKLTSWFETRDVNDLSLVGKYGPDGRASGVGRRRGGEDGALRRRGRALRRLRARDGLVPVPPVEGKDLDGVFVYRTVDDLERLVAYQKAHGVTAAAVVGGGLLGLEAAKAMHDLGMKTHILEYAPILMCRQIDAGGHAALASMVEDLGLEIHCDARTKAFEAGADGRVAGVSFTNEGWDDLDVGIVVVSAGIRPRDELARDVVDVHERGGVVVDDELRTSDPAIFAVGEVALHRGSIYGLVAPGYAMAEVAADRRRGPLPGRCAAASSSATPRTTASSSRSGSAASPSRTRPRCSSRPSRGAAAEVDERPGKQICSCNGVSRGDIVDVVAEVGDACDYAKVKKCTRAGAGCGGCEPDVKKILAAELEKLGATVFTGLCSHFDKSAPELKALLRLDDECDTFEDVIAKYGVEGAHPRGCEACKPAVAGMLAAGPTPSCAHPRWRGHAAGLMALGAVADEYGLYCKITGAQRVDLFGAAKHDLPAIWAKLGAAGFESGHAYGKALRMVKSCVGSSWCRYGVQNSVDFAVTCKDFGMIATEHGYDLYVCGNGGLNPRHAALLATGIDEATVLKYVDRFLMYYVLTANKLERTAPWFESLAPTEDARLARLKAVVIDDALGICDELERRMQHVVVDTYHDEWAEVVARPDDYAHLFKQFANTDETQAADEMIEFMDVRGQRRPSTGADGEAQTNWRPDDADVFARSQKAWLGFGPVDDYPSDIGTAILYGETQLSVFKLADGQLFVTQNMCPHKQAFVLSQGLVGDADGLAKVACPLHKKTFGLADGAELGGGDLKLVTFDARVGASGDLEIHLPPREEVDAVLATPKLKVTCDKAPKQAPAFAR